MPVAFPGRIMPFNYKNKLQIFAPGAAGTYAGKPAGTPHGQMPLTHPTADRHRPWRFYTALIVTAFVASAGITVIYGMLATLYREFPGAEGVGWVVTIYWLASAVAAAVGGRVGDLVGRRRTMLVVLACCILGAGVSALASSLAMLIAGCLLQGTAGVITPLNYGLVRENLSDEHIPMAVGLIVTAGMVGAGVIYVLSGVVIDEFSWQGGFLFKVALAAVAMLLVWGWVPDARPSPGPALDLVRGLVFVPGLCAILVAVQKLGAWGVGDPRILGLLVAGFVLLALWGRQQWNAPHPLINVRSLLERRVLIANACMMFLALGGLQLGQMFSLYFQQPAATGTGLGYSATFAGAVMFLLNISALVGGPLSGRIASRFGARSTLLAGMGTMALAWGGLAVWHGGTAVVMVLAVACSLGLAVAQGGIYNVIVAATPPERTGEATGLTYVFLACFFAVGAQCLFALLATERVSLPGGGDATYPSAGAFGLSFGFVSAMAGLAFLTALLLPAGGARRRAPLALDA